MSVHWSLKWSIFAASVISLSWFFAGWRQVNQTGGLADWALLAGGTASTLALLGLQGYWIYFEEKKRGKLTKRIALFEAIRTKIEERQSLKGIVPKPQLDIQQTQTDQVSVPKDLDQNRSRKKNSKEGE